MKYLKFSDLIQEPYSNTSGWLPILEAQIYYEQHLEDQ